MRVRSAAVNPVDWKVAAGGLDGMMNTVFPAIPGWDVAGVVERVGLDTPEFAPGDEVIAYARKDYVQGGTFAEFVTVPVRAVARKPALLDWDQAAGLPLAGLTAYQLLSRLGLREGETVLVHAAAGGVGILAVQIARATGARVIGTASEANHEVLRSFGAEPVEYGDGLADRVREIAPDGVDVVVDFIGGVLDTTLAVLTDGGSTGRSSTVTWRRTAGSTPGCDQRRGPAHPVRPRRQGAPDRSRGAGLSAGEGRRRLPPQPGRARAREDRHRGQPLTVCRVRQGAHPACPRGTRTGTERAPLQLERRPSCEATPTGLEPATSAVTGRRANQLRYGALV